MACYNPMFGIRDPCKVTKNGFPVIHLIRGLDVKDPETIDRMKEQNTVLIPCGKCIGCRLDYARSWADRMILELDHTKKSVFVTLTYADEFLPKFTELNDAGAPAAPLVKSELSVFMKRLRENLARNYDIIVRFYGCGEYGEVRGRPHMHIILFGLSLEDLAVFQDKPLKAVKRNELGQLTYESEYLEKFWKYGFANVSESNYFTMGYVARYTIKKAQGSDYPGKYKLPKEFVLMSRNPGIGAYFLEDHPDLIDEVSYWSVGGKNIYWPSYLVRKQHEIWSEEKQSYILDEEGEKIKQARIELALNNFMNTVVNDERPYYQRQEFLERQKEFAVKKLKRGDVTLN